MKKIISLIITAAMLVSFAAAPASAAQSSEEGIISLLKSLEIMQGDEMGDMQLGRDVSRAEFAKIAVAASAAKNTVAAGLKVSPYKDVKYTEWFAPYVRAAVSAGFVEGYLDATYRPNNTVTYEEAVTIMLRVLGYDDKSFGAAYPYGQIAQAQGIDMLDDVDGQIGTTMTRRQVMHLVYNTLQAPLAGSAPSVTLLSSAHECTMSENADVIATAAQDSSLGLDKVFTSVGTYTKGDYFNDASVGMTGKVFVKNSRDIIAFVPDEGYGAQDYETYFIYSTLASSVVGYRNGTFETVEIPESATVYKNQSPTTYAMVKSGLSMGDTLYVKRTNGGSIDYITYESSTMTGPVKVTTDTWLSYVGGNSQSTVMRDGVRSSASAVTANDIVYYSAPLNMVFAYTNKVTGIYENAYPTKDSPSKVTISGVEYDVEGVDAFNNLSSSGSFNFGDTVTICIGKDGGAAGVVTGAATAASSTVTGYVTDAGKKLFKDSNGKEYSSYYITMVSADGTVGTYETSYDRSSTVGSVVKATFKDGAAAISKQSSGGNVSGRVSYQNLEIGGTEISANAHILDVANDSVYDVVSYKRIYTQRLDGLNIESNKVLYCEKNSMNQITDLILNNVTNDMYTYAAVNSSNNGVYNVDVDGSTRTYNSAITKSYKGPARLVINSSGQLMGVYLLSEYSGRVTELTASTAKISGTVYKLSDSVVCYKKSVSTSYQKISIDDAINGGYSIRAYYDKPESSGGRIRILVCNTD